MHSPIDAPPAPSRTSTASRTVGLVALGVFAALLALLPLAGKTFVLTGTLPTLSRDEAKEMLEAAGAKADARRKVQNAADKEMQHLREAGEREVETDRRDVADNGEIIRSEEQLNVSKDRVETGQVRLRKYVVNETETVEVPVQREEVRVVREPITDADRANYDGNIGEQEASVTLHEDRVNVSKESVPVEKVSLEKDTVQDTERVSEEVRKERFETDGVVEGDVRDADRDNLR